MNKFITLTVACFALFVQADAASNKATVEKLYDLYENGTAREFADTYASFCLLYTSPSPRDNRVSRMPSSA